MPLEDDDLIFRTAGAWGTGKGSVLTAAEVDTNFYTLLLAIIALETSPPQPNEIVNITEANGFITVHLADATSYGPFELPVAQLTMRDDWEPTTDYEKNDLFVVDGGLYLVVQDHTSAGIFNPSAGDVDGPYAKLLIPYSVVNTFDLAMTFSGALPSDSSTIFSFVSNRDYEMPATLPDAYATLDVAITDTAVSFPIWLNGAPIGSIDFAPAGTLTPDGEGQYGTFTFASDVALEPGDVLKVKAPNTSDATAAGFAASIPIVRT